MRGGHLVTEARRRARLSQRALAERLGVPQSTVARWERGRAAPSLDTVVRAVRACGFDVDLRLVPYDESETRLIEHHVAMSPTERVRALEAMLDFERRAQHAEPLGPIQR